MNDNKYKQLAAAHIVRYRSRAEHLTAAGITSKDARDDLASGFTREIKSEQTDDAGILSALLSAACADGFEKLFVTYGKGGADDPKTWTPWRTAYEFTRFYDVYTIGGRLYFDAA